ncbi:hypothetical protein VaNZ11_015476 [Volvox africanus]|uniref:Uncharacterized protein n=1 Tax=Volvox africanus TaxID=51714 RepID=A0ABQ5SKX0_9CHLO|nr:hypothetical protein VaNZ11_015476 [Volvox africanus]
MEDDLAPRELPAFLKPVAAGAAGGRPTLPVKVVPADALPQAARTRVPLPPLPPPLPCSTVPEDAALPRWSKCRTAPLGRQPPSPQLPVPWALSNASSPSPKEEVAVQTDPELLAPAAGKVRQDSASDHEGFSPEPGHAAATSATTEEENSTARRLAWSDPEYMATPSSTGTTAAVPQPTPSPEPTETVPRDQSPGRAEESSHLVPPAKAEVQRPLRPAPLPGALDTNLEDIQLGLADGDDEADAWGELEVDRELARMKKELGIEDSDLRSSISSIDSGISVPSFLKDAAVVAIVRQAGPHTRVKAAAARARAEATAAAPEIKQVGAAGNATATDGPEQLSHATGASPCQGQGPRTAAADATTPVSDALGPAVVAVAAGGGIGTPAATSRPPPMSGITNAVAALDALGAILRPASAGSSSSVDTLDSSILRILDSSPSSTTIPTPQLDATPAAQRAAGTASRPGGAAWHSTHLTPGSSSLPSDIDDMLLLSELDWEELERLAGLRGTNIKVRGSSSPANVAAPSPAGLLGATAKTPVRFDVTGALGAASVGGFKGFSPSSTFSEISSSISNESLQRFVAQGILPPEIALLLASTPPSAVEPSRALQPASAAPAAGTNQASSTPGGGLAVQQPPPVAPVAAATLPGAADTSPTSSTISDLAALLGPLGVPMAVASNVSQTSLSSLSTYARLGRNAPANPSAAGPPSLAKPATRGLFTIPERGSISLGDLSIAGPPQSQRGPAQSQSGQSAPAQHLHHNQHQQPQKQVGKQVPHQPHGRGSVVTTTAQPGHAVGLPEPVRLRLSDLNRQLLASTGGAVSSRSISSPGLTSPSGSSRPAKPGPLFITSGTGAELQLRSLQPSPSPMLAQPNLQQAAQPRPHHQEPGRGVPGVAASALSVSLSSSATSLSLSCVSSLSLSPTKQMHQHGAPQLPSAATSVGRPTAEAAAAEGKISDTFSTLNSLGQKSGQSSGLPVGAMAESKLNSSSSAVATPVAGASKTSPAAAPATARSDSSPYDLYDKEAARLAELMATINASLRQSAEAVARAGGASSIGTSSSVSGLAASPSTGTKIPSEPDINPCQRSQHSHHATGSAAGRPATAATVRPVPSSESSASPPSTCGSSWTVSTMQPLLSPQPRSAAALCLGSQSPVAAMLQSARTAAAAAASASAAAVATTLRNAADGCDITASARGGISRVAPAAVAPVSVSRASSSRGAGASASAAPAASPSAKRPRDAVADGRTSKVSAGPRLHTSTAASTQRAAEFGPRRTDAVSAAVGEVAVTVTASCTTTGGDGTGGEGSNPQPGHPGQSVPTTPVHPIANANVSHASGDAETGSTSVTTPSSVLSNLSSVFAMLRMGPPFEPRPPSDGGPIPQPPGGARTHLFQPGSPPPPPPPPPPAISPDLSMPSPPLTPLSPILSESSYSSVSVPSASPGSALTTSLAGLGLRAPVQPPPAPGGGWQAAHEPKPAEPRISLSVSLSSSDGVSSVAEAISGILTHRIRGIGGGRTLPEPAPTQSPPLQRQRPQQQHCQDLLPGRDRQREPTPTMAGDGLAPGGDSSYATAGSDTAVGSGDGGGDRRGGHSLEVWASLTGQTLAEALEGLVSPGEPYEDLLKSSLALSSSSLSSGGALPDDDPQSLLATMAPSDRLEMSPYDAKTQGVLQEEERVPKPSMSLEQVSGRASLEQPAKGDTNGKATAQAELQALVSWSRPSSTSQILADVDAALARVTLGAIAVPTGHPAATQQDADAEAMPFGSSRETPLLPTCPGNEVHLGAAAAAIRAGSLAAQPLPEPAADPALGLCSSTSSDEFGPIMAGLIQNIQRGLAALQAPPLQVLPPPLPAPEQPAAEWRDPGQVASGLTSTSGLEGPAAAPLESTTSSLPSIPYEDDSDDEDSYHAGVMPWWPKAVAKVAQGLGSQEAEHRHTMTEVLPVAVPGDNTVDAGPPSASSSSSSEASASAARQLRQMPTLSRGIADMAASHAAHSSSNTEAWHTAAATIDAAAAAPTAAESVEVHATGNSRRISHASAASSGAASSLTLGPVDSAVVVNWPRHANAVAPGPVATTTGAYSFLQLPRASTARNRTPPSVQSGAESPTRVPSGSLSPPSISASTVSSIDSISHALAQYPVFGGATQSPMGSQSSGSSDDDRGGATAAGDVLPYSDIDTGVTVGLEAVAIRPRLPIQYQPSQPQLPAPLLFSSIAQEPWKGAWDLPLQAIPAGAGASTPDAAGAEMLGLYLEEAAAHARRGVGEAELLQRTEDHGLLGQDISFGAVSTGGEVNGEFLGGVGYHRGHGPISGLHTSAAHPWQTNFLAASQLETEQGSRFEPGVALEPESVLPEWARREPQLLSSVEATDDESEFASEPDSRHQQQALSPFERRQLLGLQPLTLEIPVAGDQQTASGEPVVKATATQSGPDGAGDATTIASAGVIADSATPLQTPFSNFRVRLRAGSPQEEQPPVLPSREHGDLSRRRGADTVGAGPGGGGGGGGSGGYVGALSEELLSDLLMWTVSDFFSSPARGATLDVDH